MNNENTNHSGEVVDGGSEPATAHDVKEGGILGAVGGAVVGLLAGGPIGAVIGAVAGGAASAAAINVVDKHDHDYDRTEGTDTTGTHAAGTTGTAPAANYAPAENYASSATAAPSYAPAAMPAALRTDTTDTVDGERVIPIVEEELQVGKRQVQSGGARVHTDIIETPVDESVNLREEHVTVDRHAVNRPVSGLDTAFQEQNYEITETSEVPVVAKTARVVEEVVVGKTATERVETVHDTVRRTDVEVEELNRDGSPIR